MAYVKRSPMTEKKRRAIHTYVSVQCAKNGMLLNKAVEFTLYAEKMPADSLYAWLEAKGYRWRSHSRVWSKNERAG